MVQVVLVLAVLVLVHNLLQCGKERCMLVQDGEAEDCGADVGVYGVVVVIVVVVVVMVVLVVL